MTALGIDNTGDYVFSYGKEDTDYYVDGDPTSDYVFRVADSVFFCRLRDLFPSELQAMFKDREEKNAWSSVSLIDQWDNSQAKFPEELWRLDYERKYYRTYLGLSIDNSINTGEGRGIDKSFLIGKFFGRKKYARRAFESNQEIYFATKYFGNKALSDVFWIRGNVPIGSNIKPNYSLTLVPYSDMYVCVKYSSTGTPIHKKVKAGQTCRFESDAERMDFIYVYAASFIQEVGDLSKCYVGDNNFSSATRLQKLVIGSTDNGYTNTFMKEVLVANNPLLEHLDLRNISGIDTVINVSGCSNLKELYAEGTNATGVIFANGSLLQTTHLPSTIKSLSMKNLNYITDSGFVITNGFGNLETLIVENTPNINTYNIVINAPKLSTLRLIGLDWNATYGIANASIFDRLLTIGGLDSSGYETDMSVLTGGAHVAVIEEQQAYNFKTAWSDLEITYNTMVLQHPVTFVNDDGTVLEVQYVNEGEYPVDPVTRTENPIAVPTKESTVSTKYTYAGWDNPLTSQIFSALTVTAKYSESIREYTIKYVSKGLTGNIIVKQETVGKYGENIPYDFETHGIPTYTYEENAYNFYLFNRWDKSGFIDGDKTVTAIFDSFKYTGSSSFIGKNLGDLRPVEIYALSKLTESGKSPIDFGMSIEVADPLSFTMGYDIDFDDIESNEVISDKTTFNGTNYLDTGIKLFDIDKDFVLVLDYTMSKDNDSVGTFMQCFQTSGSNGFKLGYSGTSPEFVWGSASSIKPCNVDNREMLVVRHKKGDNNLYVYVSNLDSPNLSKHTIERSAITSSDNATLVFGAAKMDSGRITNYCMGDVHWCKIWYQDLGEKACEQLVGWTHEKITLGVSGFYRYPLYDDRGKEAMVSLVASHLLDRKMKYNNNNTNVGGWAKSDLNKILNTRFYNAVPVQIRLLLKKMCVLSTIGQASSEVSESGCYINIPSVYDVDNSEIGYKNELYSGASTIKSMATQQSRRREFRYGFENDNIDVYESYWLRSPNTAYTSYVWSVNENYSADTHKGTTSGFNTANTSHGVVIEISF